MDDLLLETATHLTLFSARAVPDSVLCFPVRTSDVPRRKDIADEKRYSRRNREVTIVVAAVVVVPVVVTAPTVITHTRGVTHSFSPLRGRLVSRCVSARRKNNTRRPFPSWSPPPCLMHGAPYSLSVSLTLSLSISLFFRRGQRNELKKEEKKQNQTGTALNNARHGLVRDTYVLIRDALYRIFYFFLNRNNRQMLLYERRRAARPCTCERAPCVSRTRLLSHSRDA